MSQTLLAIDEDSPGPRASFRDPKTTIAFMLAGNAHVTFQSERTGKRFTYRIVTRDTPGRKGIHFVSMLTGLDNYTYLGCVFDDLKYHHGRKSPIDVSSKGAGAFRWVWRNLVEGRMHPELAVWHEGRCGKCGRRLTDPASIASGLGPICRGDQ